MKIHITVNKVFAISTQRELVPWPKPFNQSLFQSGQEENIQSGQDDIEIFKKIRYKTFTNLTPEAKPHLNLKNLKVLSFIKLESL